jgi:sulfate transport system ATP-binding protein
VTHRPAKDRQVGFVFQHYALFRHLNVFENVAFGLRVRPRPLRPAEEAIRKKVTDLLRLVQLEDLAGRYPNQLSGGQRQRAALARALAAEPKVLLLDEPFGALDAKVRKELRRWIRRLHNEIHITSIFVTHDQNEALDVAGRVVVMNDGRIVQLGTPDEVYEAPANPFVFNFLGRAVSLRGRVQQGQLRLGDSVCAVPEHAAVLDAPATVFARPQHVKVSATSNGSLGVQALVRDVNLAGPLVYLELERLDDGTFFEVEVPNEHARSLALHPGTRVHVNLKKYRVFVEDYSI